MASRLTNTALSALAKGDTIRDDVVRGLHATKNRDGTISWLLSYRTKLNDRRHPKLGEFPTVTIASARELARDMLNEVAKGNDPVLDRIVHRTDWTMDRLAEEMAREVYNNGKAWDKEAMRLYHHFISPVIGGTRARAVAMADAQAIFDRFQGGTKTTANRTLSVLSKMMLCAVRWGQRDEGAPSPTAKVERHPERKRGRFGDPGEIKCIFDTLDRIAAEEPIYVCGAAYLYVLLFTGMRPSEPGNAKREWLEPVQYQGQTFGRLTLHVHKTAEKTGQSREVVIPPEAMKLFDQMPPNRLYLCGDHHRRFPRYLWARVRKEAAEKMPSLKTLWARDLRRTFATYAMSFADVQKGKIGGMLGHASAQTTERYALLAQQSHFQASGEAAAVIARVLATGSAAEASTDDAVDAIARQLAALPKDQVAKLLATMLDSTTSKRTA